MWSTDDGASVVNRSTRVVNESLFGPAFTQDPYQFYSWLREHDPVCRVTLPDGKTVWLLTRYRDVRDALRDPRLSKEMRYACENSGSPFKQSRLACHMLSTDPPRHGHLRRLVSDAFTTEKMAHLRPRVVDIARQLIGRLDRRRTVDLIAEYALPLSCFTICDLLGIRTDVYELHDVAFAAVSPPPGHTREERAVNVAALEQKILDIIETVRSGERGDTPLGALLSESSHDSAGLSGDDIIAMVFLLLVAGYENTANLIGNSFYLLFRHPQYMSALRRDLSLMSATVEEVLRYEPPASRATILVAKDSVEYGGVRISRGEMIMAVLASANRDSGRFANADVFDPARVDRGHLSFGQGVHYCLGSHMGRMEGVVALTESLSHFPEMKLAVPIDELEWRESSFLRGLVSLPVRLG